MNDPVASVVEILKHLQGRHDQRSHGRNAAQDLMDINEENLRSPFGISAMLTKVKSARQEVNELLDGEDALTDEQFRNVTAGLAELANLQRLLRIAEQDAKLRGRRMEFDDVKLVTESAERLRRLFLIPMPPPRRL